jgi:capsid protein
MADPVSAGLGLVGGLFNIFGAMNEADQRRRQFQIQGVQAIQRAADALSRGGNAAARALGEGDRLKGSQIASTAGRNLEIGVGTAAQIVGATDLIASIDALTIRENARREARGYLTEAYNASEGIESTSATPAVVGTLIGTGGQFAESLYRRRTRPEA